MKLNEIAKNKEPKNPFSNGLYVGASLSQNTKDKLKEASNSNGIENLTDKYHITIMYTLDDGEKFSNEESDDVEYDPPYIATPKKFRVFKTQDEKNALVIEVECEELTSRHNEIKDQYSFEYTRDEYIPHVTLSYDCGDFDYSKIDVNDFINEIEIIGEYYNPIDPNWV